MACRTGFVHTFVSGGILPPPFKRTSAIYQVLNRPVLVFPASTHPQKRFFCSVGIQAAKSLGVRGLREAFLNSQGGTQVCGAGYFDACFGASACLFDTFARSEDAAGATCLRSGVWSWTVFRESITWIYAEKTVRWRASNRCFVPSETLTDVRIAESLLTRAGSIVSTHVRRLTKCQP